MAVMDDIHEILEQVGDTTKFNAMTMDELTVAEAKIAVLRASLAEFVSAFTKESYEKEAFRKLKFAENWNRIKKEKMGAGLKPTVGELDNEAETQIWTYRTNELEAQMQASRFRLYFDSLPDVINSIKDRIKFLMQERQLEPKTEVND